MTEPLTHHISPRFTAAKASPGTFVDWVEIWEDRMSGWLLAPAKALAAADPNYQIGALLLAVAFLEPYEVFRTGADSDGKSSAFFCRAFRRVFGASEPAQPAEVWDEAAQEFYKQVRCGLFHSGMPGTKVWLTSAITGIRIDIYETTGDVQQILVNPSYFVSAVESELAKYIGILRDPSHPVHIECRAAFETAWHLVHKQ